MRDRPHATTLASLREEALQALRRGVSADAFGRDLGGARTPEDWVALAADEAAPPYGRLAAGLCLALIGDRRGIPVLRMVFDRPGFAITNSCNEQGLAALGLALLGDRASAARIDSCVRINASALHAEIARQLLAASAEPR